MPAGCIPLPTRKPDDADAPLTILNGFRLLAASSMHLFDSATRKTIISNATITEADETFFEFVHKFVLLNYGIRRVNNWLKVHPHKTVLQLITPQDLAYSILVYETNYAQFRYDYLSANGRLDPDDQRPAQDLTISRNTKLNAYECNWDADAIKYYLELSRFFFKLMRPENGVWGDLLEKWDEFHAGVDGSKLHRYRQNKRDDQRAANNGQTTGQASTLYIPFHPIPSGDGQFFDPSPAPVMPDHKKKRGAECLDTNYELEGSEAEEESDDNADEYESDEEVVPAETSTKTTQSKKTRRRF